MGSISKLALGSVVLGCVAFIGNIAWFCFYWFYTRGAPVWVEQLVPLLGFILSPILGLVAVGLGMAALDRPGVRNRSVARVGSALGMLPLLLICLGLAIRISRESLGAFGQ